MGDLAVFKKSLRGGFVDTPRRIWSHPYTRHQRARRLGRWLAWQGWQRLVRRPWTVTLHGPVRVVCHPHDMVASLALYHGLYDMEEMSFLLAWLRPGDTFVDVGANIAPYSLLAASVDGVGVVAFEPGDEARRRAAANVALNSMGDRVVLSAAAVSDRDGRARLTASHRPTDHLVDEAAGPDGDGDVAVAVAVVDGTPTREVPTVRLDTYAAREGLARVALVKVDVEGHELDVLAGAAGLLDRDRPALVVEVNEPVAALAAWIAEAGYVPVRYDWARRTLVPDDLPTKRGGNVVLVPDLARAQARLHGQGAGNPS
jgi:FkbM family methyltransferase